MGRKVGSQLLQKLGMTRNIRPAKIVNRFDDSHPEKMTPNPVHSRSREIGVLTRGHPIGERSTGTDLGSPLRLCPIQIGRLNHGFLFRNR